ncbi:4-(cytidine 5'-diphospho)-2-C-methyl-D-erythritol kinase [Thermohalobacter berrensis]|uniref:4-diphosphocytidyl-2-C-methyl-D-erythritol kinase n=1 Tax=Thermohalobacter berrensis TaxID=99594 RepID=A0A419T0B0_9FIRM|nr:4-(cytidine 5'-diphospho)-2-C-methyl-D-erythritol kinase [Thermohalobacter berrensis]RKD30915.1 4-(cytidine 5'-diphospho)-2-C-methyl-D-erythritol kinase [Thermohalobacter berrensis]
MKRIIVDAYAKINLSLDVLRRREDGYHEVEMIMQQVDLKDIITIKEIEKGIIIESNKKEVPTDSSNLVYKAWDIICKKFNIDRGVYININKNIPIAAGLAGGSSDAAALLKGLNKLWNLGLTKNELMELGVNIGADVPFCIMGGTALAQGIGEKLTRLNNFSNIYILLATPDIQVSTAYVYKNLNLKEISVRPDTHKLIEYMEDNDIDSVAKKMVNVLENVTIKKYPIIQEIKKDMINGGALGSLMSGSGPTVFGIYNNEKLLKETERKLKKRLSKVYSVKTI